MAGNVDKRELSTGGKTDRHSLFQKGKALLSSLEFLHNPHAG
jgi:hypothetical protein